MADKETIKTKCRSSYEQQRAPSHSMARNQGAPNSILTLGPLSTMPSMPSISSSDAVSDFESGPSTFTGETGEFDTLQPPSTVYLPD